MGEQRFQVSLYLLGGHILVRCKHQMCARGIAEYYSAAVIQPWCTPDVIVDCDWPEAGRYLFRARGPEQSRPLEGVRVRQFGQDEAAEWKSSSPPLPPLVVHPFSDRFVGLHGGAVGREDGKGLLLVGAQGSGKSYATLALANEFEFLFLTDETICVHRRTRLVEPFPRPIGKWIEVEQGITKETIPVSKGCRRPATDPMLMTHVVFLQPATSAGGLKPLPCADAFPQFLEHHIDVGSSADEAMVTLFYLAKYLRSAVFRYPSFEQLVHSVSDLAAFVNE